MPFLSPGDLPDPGIEPESLAFAGGFFTIEPPGKLLFNLSPGYKAHLLVSKKGDGIAGSISLWSSS